MSADHLLAQCIRSGQAGAEQIHQHIQAGEVRRDWDRPGYDTMQRLYTRDDLPALQQEIADEAARSDVECIALSVPRYHNLMPVYDLAQLSPDLPTDDDMQQDYRAVLDKAVRYVELRGLLVRPWKDSPSLVCFARGA